MRSLLSVMMLSVLVLGGCKMSSDRLESSGTAATDVSKSSSHKEFSVRGRVVKGVISGAEVALYIFDELNPERGVPIATSETQADGRFQLSVDSSFLGMPAYVEVTSGPGGAASMVCDLDSGCGSASFSEVLLLDETFKLSAVLPMLKRSSIVNVTTLTHLAAQTLKFDYRSPAKSDQFSKAEDLLNLQSAISRINSMVASRFGVVGNLTSLEPVDLTSVEELTTAHPEQIYYSALVAGSFKAVFALDGIETVPDAIQHLTQQYAVFGMKSSSEEGDPNRFYAFSDLLEATKGLLTYLQENETQVDFSSVLSEIATAKGLADSDTLNLYDSGEASKSASLTDLGQARALIRDISQVTASINLPRLVSLTNVSSLVDPKVSAAIDQFGFEISAAQFLEGKRSDALIDGFGSILTTIIEVLVLQLSNEDIPSSLNGIEFQHQVQVDSNGWDVVREHDFVFQVPFDACLDSASSCMVTPSLTVKVHSEGASGNKSDNKLLANLLTLSFDGGIDSDGLKLSLSPINQVLEFESLILGEQADDDTTEILFQASKFTLAVPFQLVFDELQDDGLKMKGVLDIGANNTTLEYLKIDVDPGGAGERVSESRTAIHSIENLKASISAGLTNVAGDKSFIAAMGLSQGRVDVTSPITYVDLIRSECATFEQYNASECSVEEEYSEFQNESESNFLSLAASVGFKANLKGLDTPVLLEITGAREGPETNRIDRMKLRYPGQAISLQGTFRTGKIKNKSYMEFLDAVSLDGTRMKIESDISGNRSGKITNSLDEQIAEITDMGEWLNIRFENGDFESFCRC